MRFPRVALPRRLGRRMNAGHAIAYATLQGLTTVLPISESGHFAAAAIWLERKPDTLAAFAGVGCLAALLVALRHRFVPALSEGMRGIARPGILQSSAGGRDAVAVVLAACLGATLQLLLTPLFEPIGDVPAAVGAGLSVTGVGLLSTRFAPAPRRACPGPPGALLVGLALGLATAPGTSRVGAAFVVLCWLGVTAWRAAELSLMISAPVLTLELLRSLLQTASLDTLGAEAALGAVIAFVAATLAVGAWRVLCERHRTALLSLWLLPLALAMVGYGRALPIPT